MIPAAQWLIPGLFIVSIVFGAVAALHPIIAIVCFTGLLGIISVLLSFDRLPQVFLIALGLLLVGYAFCGKGFAYIGVRPVYIGECVLILGVLAALAGWGIRPALRSHVSKLFLVFAAWSGLCTFPYIGLYGADSLRDGVVWGYGSFALLVSALLIHAGAINRIPEYFARFIPWILCWIPLAMVIRALGGDVFPTTPGTEVPLVSLKGGDAAVHLAGIGAFLLLGLHSGQHSYMRSSLLTPEWLLWVGWFVGVFMVSIGRGALLSLLTSLFVVWVVRPVNRRWLKLILLAAIIGGGLLIIGTEIDLQYRSRTFGPKQIINNITSIFSETAAQRAELSGTRQWRLNWWEDIVDYTVFGDHFWMGKGYGVNLADVDNYQVTKDKSLRSPHNVHMTILARSGVPGAVLWIGLQLVFASSLLCAYFEARRRGDEWWARLDLWVLAYWTAFMVNGTFDVYLEGPQGSIWFWSLFGFGIALLELQRQRRRICLYNILNCSIHKEQFYENKKLHS